MRNLQDQLNTVNEILEHNCIICCVQQLESVKEANPKARIMLANASVFDAFYETTIDLVNHDDARSDSESETDPFASDTMEDVVQVGGVQNIVDKSEAPWSNGDWM
jgi:hypothetical protein